MEFPIAGVTVNPFLLAGIGFLVGILGGFFGVGGGFIAGPFMFWAGVPMNFVVGTDLAHMTGKSIVASKRHRALGHVDVKLGMLMVLGTIVGVEVGAQIIEGLENSGRVDIIIGVTYVVILLLISAFTAWESLRALRMIRTDQMDVKDAVGIKGLSERVHGFKLWPMISLPASGITSISLWTILGVGFITGVLSGSLGVGGGFIRMPLLVYVMGLPTHVAIGTDLFEIVFSSAYGTLTHALKGNVDILMALVMQTGAAVGAQIGATSTRFFAGPKIRLFFSALPIIGAVMVLIELLTKMSVH
ncbi:MAG: sulfite exporter TauE/SafE family protein [Anaerolineales bacterium]|nr:sulfite exporter TauE/SafE family protein [Anaerolineales bacterium]